ncbi:MAG: hypothetical protein LBR12_03690 [Opitutaceae bacterium]|jgi:hypothetical protein|nr:hypothetical protein [Opitutaceae bacterium]
MPPCPPRLLCFFLLTAAAAQAAVIPDNYTPENNGLLFGETSGDFYNYAPCVMLDDDGSAHAWYCANEASGDVTDCVAYRHGLKQDGVWHWSPRQDVLNHGAQGEWDSRHVCDPDVVRGNFTYNGRNYRYLMAYLGCTSNDNSANSTGLAVANSPAGPWLKTTAINPLLNFNADFPGYNGDPWLWGYGQATLVNLDKNARILIFFTGVKSDTGQRVEEWDLSNLNAPVLLFSSNLNNSGTAQLDSPVPDYLSNASVAYDAARARFLMLCDTHPWDNSIEPTNIPTTSRLHALKDIPGVTPGSVFQSLNYTWKILHDLDPVTTGFPRNHNTAIVRDPFGWLPDGDTIETIYTTSITSNVWVDTLWSYRLRRHAFPIPVNTAALTSDEFLAYALINGPINKIPATNGTLTHLPSTSLSNGSLSMTFTPARAGFTYEVQRSNDLQTWTTLQSLTGPALPTNATAAPVTILSPTSVNETPRQFLRLKITPPRE